MMSPNAEAAAFPTILVSPLQEEQTQTKGSTEDDDASWWCLMNPRDDLQPIGCHLNLDCGADIDHGLSDLDILPTLVANDVDPDDDDNYIGSEDRNEYLTRRSDSIPFVGVRRTLSEEQLCAENQAAELRDHVMFHRIVNGIAKQQQETTNYYSRQVNDMCLASIIGTRRLTEQQLKDYQGHSAAITLDAPLPPPLPMPLHRQFAVAEESTKPLVRVDSNLNLVSLLQFMMPPALKLQTQSQRFLSDPWGVTATLVETNVDGWNDNNSSDECIFELEL